MSETPHFSAMIEEQIRRWQGLKKQNEKPAPVIVLSREYGTGGSLIGSHLASKLNFKLWDQKLIQAIAENVGLSSNFLRALDEHSRSTVEDIITGVFVGQEGTEMAFVSQIYRIVHTIEKHGAGIIVGRGAQFIVDPEKALRVRIVAPMSSRIQWVSDRESLDKKEAEKKIRRIDKERSDFHRRYFAKDASEASHYDVVLNASTLLLESVANVIISSYKERFG